MCYCFRHTSVHSLPVSRIIRLAAWLLTWGLLALGLSGCAATEASETQLALGGFSTIYVIDTEANTVLWTKTFDSDHIGWLQDEDTVYIGTNDGTIRAFSAGNGELLWEQAASFASPFQGLMDLEDGTLYYSGAETDGLDWPIYALDLETRETEALPVGTGTLSNFSVQETQLYACSGTGITVYDLITRETAVFDLEDPDYFKMSISGDCLTVAYVDRVEWYTVTASGLTLDTTVFYEEMSLKDATLVAANDSVALVLDRANGAFHEEATLYAWLLDSQTLLPWHTLTDSPGYITFTDTGFYALWEDSLRWYDYEGNWVELKID